MHMSFFWAVDEIWSMVQNSDYGSYITGRKLKHPNMLIEIKEDLGRLTVEYLCPFIHRTDEVLSLSVSLSLWARKETKGVMGGEKGNPST